MLNFNNDYADTQEEKMVDRGKVNKGYRFNRRMLFKMQKLLETHCWDSETELLEASVDILYEMMIKGELPKGFSLSAKKIEDSDKKDLEK